MKSEIPPIKNTNYNCKIPRSTFFVVCVFSLLIYSLSTIYRSSGLVLPPLSFIDQIPENLSRSDPYLTLHVDISDDPLSDKIGQPELNPSPKHLHVGSKAMVASDVPLCSTMGKEILLRGRNAADAAVTVALCIGSVNSHSSGIGGG